MGIDERGVAPRTQPSVDDEAIFNALMGKTSAPEDKNEFYEMVRELFKDEKLDFITELSENEIKRFTKLIVVHAWTGGTSQLMPVLLETYKRLMISKQRRGRGEVIDAVRPQNQFAVQEEQKGWMSKMFSPRN